MTSTSRDLSRKAPSGAAAAKGPWLLRGELFSVAKDPFRGDAPADCLLHEEDGGLWVDAAGVIQAVGPWSRVREAAASWAHELRQEFPPVLDARGHVIAPGFVDAHCHFPQLDLIGSYSGELLEWLRTATFPLEEAFADAAVATDAAELFITSLFAHGTTTAAVFGSSHAEAADTLFAAAARRGLRACIGKVSMDRHAPPGLLVDVDRDWAESEALIRRWHGGAEGLLSYAVTPRFAPSCTPALLEALGDLARRHPDVMIQTHHAESPAEVAWVRELFPEAPDYLAAYERFGLVGPRTLLAHAIHVTPAEEERMAAHGAHVVHCPSSNLFLGSGLCRVEGLRRAGVAVALGSDVGAGTTFSLWQTMAEAYKVARLRGEPLHPVQLFHLATQAGAEALGQGARLGSLAVGKAADVQLVAVDAHPLLSRRFRDQNPIHKLFRLMHFVDRQCITGVWVQGRRVHDGAPAWA